MSKVEITKKEDNVLWAKCGSYDIEVFREASDEDWYIIVQGEDGYLYDGWWDDSANATTDDALNEALRGAML